MISKAKNLFKMSAERAGDLARLYMHNSPAMVEGLECQSGCLNCFQAVAAATNKAHPDQQLVDIETLASGKLLYGGGNAPGGMCGALYASLTANPSEKDRILKQWDDKFDGLRHCDTLYEHPVHSEPHCKSYVEHAAKITFQK